MSLHFAVCPKCHERHALRADGRMSIHTNAKGKRCEVLYPKALVSAPRSAKRPASEMDVALAFSAARKRGTLPKSKARIRPSTPYIYALGRVRFVSGR